MDLNHLQVFVAVADEGSFTRAAEALGLAKSTVSERVRALEDQRAPLLRRYLESVRRGPATFT